MKSPDPRDVAAVLLSGWLIGAGGLALAQQGPAPEPLPQPAPQRPGGKNDYLDPDTKGNANDEKGADVDDK